MLTYSLSINKLTIILPLKKIASAQIAKSFWHAPYKSEELSNITEDIERTWEVVLANHREKTISASNVFIEKHSLPSRLKNILKESIFSLYQAYRQMLLWKITYDPYNKIDLLKEGELYAPNYFNADGEFNDFIWAKHFVSNLNCNKYWRFYIACFYWFENESAVLWSEMKNSHTVPYGGDLNVIRDRMESPIVLRIFRLENQVQALAQYWKYDCIFFHMGLKEAAERGYEHATYYFWDKTPEPDKISITQNDAFFELLSEAVDYPDDKVSYFLYTQLSNKRKKKLLNWTIEHNKPRKWLTLLLSPYTQAIRQEIFKFVCQLPIDLFSDLLQSLAYRIKQNKLPFDIKMFQKLWSDLSPEEKSEVLEKKFLIQTLIEAKSCYNLGYIIKSLSLEEKEECLINGMYGAGISSLDILSEEGEFDLLQKYLFFFLIETDPLTQKEILRKDANSFLQKFVESFEFETWCQQKINKAEVKEVKNRIAILQISLSLLEELCEKVCKGVSVPRPLMSSFFKADAKVNEEPELTFSSSNLKRKMRRD